MLLLLLLLLVLLLWEDVEDLVDVPDDDDDDDELDDVGRPDIDTGGGVTPGRCADPNVDGWGVTPGNTTCTLVGPAVAYVVNGPIEEGVSFKSV